MLKIIVSNRLDNENQFEFEFAPFDDVYLKVSQKIEISDSAIIIFNGNDIVKRNTKIGEISNSNNIKLSYFNGKEIDKKIKDFQYSPIKKQTGIDSFKVISSSKILQQDYPNSEKIKKILENKKELEKQIAKLEKIIENLQNENDSEKQIDSENQIQSFKEITSSCQYCQNLIENHIFQTPCCHSFHFECLEFLLTSQITNGDTSLHCNCKYKINLNILWQVIKNYDEAIIYKKKIFSNQLNKIQQELKNKNQCMSCNKGCGCFYYKGKMQNKQEQYFCVRCEQKTMFNPW